MPTWRRSRRFGAGPTSPVSSVAYSADARRRRRDRVAGLRGRRFRGPARRGRAVLARRHVPDGLVPEPGRAGSDGPADRDRPTRRTPSWRSPTIPTPTDLLLRFRSPTARGGDSAATRSDGCSPTICSAWTTIPIGSWSRRSCRRRCSARWLLPTASTSAETFTGFKWIARAVLDHPDLRFVLGYEQALGYLVADRPLDKDGITRRRAVRRDRRRRGCSRRAHVAGVARRHRSPVRPPRPRRCVGADGAGRCRGQGCRPAGRSADADRRAIGAAAPRSIPRPTCCDSSSIAVCGYRSDRAAPSRRSSSTARRSTRTRRRSSTRWRHCSAETARSAGCATRH